MKKLFFLLLSFCFITFNSFSQVTQQQTDSYWSGTATGTNTYSVTISKITATSPYNFQTITVNFGNANTGASTLKVTIANGASYAAKGITLNGAALVAGDIQAGINTILKYNSSSGKWQMQPYQAGSVTSAATYTSSVTPTDTIFYIKKASTGLNYKMTRNNFNTVVGNQTYTQTGNEDKTTTGTFTHAVGGNSLFSVGSGAMTMAVTATTGHTIFGSDGNYTFTCDTVFLQSKLKLPNAGTPGASKVLTSDATGIATWQTPTSGWALDGNTVGSEKWIGTIDNYAFPIRTNNTLRGTIGATGLWSIGTATGTGKFNIMGNSDVPQLVVQTHSTQNISNSPLFQLTNVVGTERLRLHSDTNTNIFLGYRAGYTNNAVGGAVRNIFQGYLAGSVNTTGAENIGIGWTTLGSTGAGLTGGPNVGIGNGVMIGATSANQNTAVGHNAMENTTTSGQNTALGAYSLESNTTSSYNTAIGAYAMQNATTATYNVALGLEALKASQGAHNFAGGYGSLILNTTGEDNVAIGSSCLAAVVGGRRNTAIGANAVGSSITSGESNILIGWAARPPSNVSSTLWIDVGAGTIPAIYGDLSARTIGLGTITPGARLDVVSTGSTSATYGLKVNTSAADTLLHLRSDGKVYLGSDGTNTTAGDAATIDQPSGSFIKDATGTTFTLTNALITAKSEVFLQLQTAGITTGYQLSVVPGAGSAVITFETAGVPAAPSGNATISFLVIN